MADVVVQPLARKKTAFQRHRQFMMDSASRFQRHARAYSAYLVRAIGLHNPCSINTLYLEVPRIFE